MKMAIGIDGVRTVSGLPLKRTIGARRRVPRERTMQTYDGMSCRAVTTRLTVFAPPQHTAARTRSTFPRSLDATSAPDPPRSNVTIIAPARIETAARYPSGESRSFRKMNANRTVNSASVFDRRAAFTGVVRLRPVKYREGAVTDPRSAATLAYPHWPRERRSLPRKGAKATAVTACTNHARVIGERFGSLLSASFPTVAHTPNSIAPTRIAEYPASFPEGFAGTPRHSGRAT